MKLTHNFILITLLILLATNAHGQDTQKLNGIVTDKGGNPLMGCNILIKGTAIGTATNVCGEFSMQIPQGEIVIVFHSTSDNDSRAHETKLNANEIKDEQIVFQIGKLKTKNTYVKRLLTRN